MEGNIPVVAMYAIYALPVIAAGFLVYLTYKTVKADKKEAASRPSTFTLGEDGVVDEMDKILAVKPKNRTPFEDNYYTDLVHRAAHLLYKQKRGKFFWQIVADRKKEAPCV